MQLIFCVATAIYVKRHTLEGNKDIKKAVTKVLIYLTITSATTYINSVIPSAIPPFREALQVDDLISFLAISYITALLFHLPTISEAHAHCNQDEAVRCLPCDTKNY